jgi:hypothetical protein
MHTQWFSMIPQPKETIYKGIWFMKVQNPQNLGLQHIKQHVYTTKLG